MKKTFLATTLTGLILSATLFSGQVSAQPVSTAVPSQAEAIDFSKLTPQQKDQLGQLISDYLVEHPDFLLKASQKLQDKERQQQEKLMHEMVDNAVLSQDALLNDPDSPSIGPKDAAVTFIEFFDYNCVFCSRIAPDIEKIIAANPDVRFVFKEYPIFDSRFPSSDLAAKVGFKVLKEKGDSAYLTYHNAVYATKHFEGELTEQDVIFAAKKVGVDATKLKPNEYQDLIDKNKALAQKIKLTGTPVVMVMPSKNAANNNTFVSPGQMSEKEMQGIINQIKALTKK